MKKAKRLKKKAIQKRKKKKKLKSKKLKKKLKKNASKKKKHSKKKKGKEEKVIKEDKVTKEVINEIAPEIVEKAKAMAPMTKEEWEKRQNILQKIYDKETGRYR